MRFTNTAQIAERLETDRKALAGILAFWKDVNLRDQQAEMRAALEAVGVPNPEAEDLAQQVRMWLHELKENGEAAERAIDLAATLVNDSIPRAVHRAARQAGAHARGTGTFAVR